MHIYARFRNNKKRHQRFTSVEQNKERNFLTLKTEFKRVIPLILIIIYFLILIFPILVMNVIVKCNQSTVNISFEILIKWVGPI